MQIDRTESLGSASISNEIQEKSIEALVGLDYISSLNQSSANTIEYIHPETGEVQILVKADIVGEELGLNGVDEEVTVAFQSMDSRLNNIDQSISSSLDELKETIAKNIEEVNTDAQDDLETNLQSTALDSANFNDALVDLENSLLSLINIDDSSDINFGVGIQSFMDTLESSFDTINMDKEIFDLISDGDDTYGSKVSEEGMFDENGNPILGIDIDNGTFIIDDGRSVQDILKGKASVDPNDSKADELFYSYDATIDNSYSGVIDAFGKGEDGSASPQEKLLAFQFNESAKKNAEFDARKRSTQPGHDPTQESIPVVYSPTASAFMVAAIGQTLIDKVNTERDAVDAINESWIDNNLSFASKLDGDTNNELKADLNSSLNGVFSELLNDASLVSAYNDYQGAKAALAENPDDLTLKENAKNALLSYSESLTDKFSEGSGLSEKINDSFSELKLDDSSSEGILEELDNFTHDLKALTGEMSDRFDSDSGSTSLEDKSIRELILLMFIFSMFAESEWDAQVEANMYSSY